MIPYDRAFDPPAPVLAVEVANPMRPRRRQSVSALIDTGSDITALPATLVNSLRLSSTGRLRLEGVESRSRWVVTYSVQVTVADVTIARLKVVPVAFEFGVLGRDALKSFHILLNGPESVFDIRTTSFALR